MKKLIVLMAIVGVIFSFSAAGAALIGVDLTGKYPDIFFDNSGKLIYDATNQTLGLIDAIDLSYSDGSNVYSMFGTGKVSMFMNMSVDNNGKLLGTGFFTEKVESGYITLKGETYNVGDILLSGTVYAFGWEGSLNSSSTFDFIAGNVWGKLVDDGFWNGGPNTGIVLRPDDKSWNGSFSQDFEITKVKGDKAPIPEPATMILFGTSLVGLGLLQYRKRFKG